MVYGTRKQARAYDEKGKIEEWLQLFLRNDGKNIALADGLLLEERRYLGLLSLDLSLLEHIEEGAPEYLKEEADRQYFFYIVDRMKQCVGTWDVPPLIIEYKDGEFYVNDGRHRLELFRQLGRQQIEVVLWTTGEENYRQVRELIK